MLSTLEVRSRADAEALDRADPLARHREHFILPEGVTYLDGNSLGPLTHAAQARVAETLAGEWGQGLIRSWNAAGWVHLPHTVAAKIAPLVGAASQDIVVTDSTSVNLFKVLAAALSRTGERRIILSERTNFPTDLYIAEGVAERAGAELVLVDDALAALDGRVAVLMLTQVDYRTGRRHDMDAVTAAAHAAGALVVWDLAHSAGAFPVDLRGADADFAVGCGYKYLNGGPGAPAFVWVVPRHQDARQPLSGWFGHADPFAFEAEFRPAVGIHRYLSGTPPVLSMAALDGALDVLADVDLAAVAAKAGALGDLMIALVEAWCGDAVTLASPRRAQERGSQVSFRCEMGYPVMQALIAAGVIGDFRAPDILRFGFAPLYTRFADVFDAAERLACVLRTRVWERPQFHERAPVT